VFCFLFMSMQSGFISFLVILAIIILAGILNYIFSFLQWYMATSAGIKISLAQLFKMKRRGIPVNRILDNLVKARYFNLPVSWDHLQKLHENGGDLYNVTDGMVKGKLYGINITFERAVQADQQKINIPEAVEIIARYRGLNKLPTTSIKSDHVISPIFPAY
jgi:uncharacterized protein YqfA (UPF0365 family)